MKIFDIDFAILKKKRNESLNGANVHKRTLHKNLHFTATEQYKILRTNLDFTIPVDVNCPVIGVTSSMRGEGKSTTAINLSYVLAERGSKVLLIDGDLRIPSLAKKMGTAASPGLTNFLMNKEEYQLHIFKSEILDNWYIMPSGDIPPNPSELIGSKRMESALQFLRREFDYIIIDLPPVNIVTDALSISSLITGMVIVIREEYTEKKELERCFRQLKLAEVKVLGCIINESKPDGASYGKYKYKKYKYYNYYAGEYRSKSSPAPEEDIND